MPTRPRVLLSLLTEQEELQQIQAEAARTAAVREGVDLEVTYAENNPILQLQQLYRAVNGPAERRPTAVVAHAVAMTGGEGVARTAVQAGIGWVLLGERAPFLDALHREHPSHLVACVYVDNEEVGRMQGRILRALLPSGGSVLCVDGPAMSGVAQNRRRGLETELAGSRVKTVKSVAADWTAAGAERAVASWVRQAADGARPGAIAAQNDEMAAGVARALAAVRPQWATIPITGCDGLPDFGVRLVRDRALAATIVIPPRGGLAVELVAKHMREEPVPYAAAVSPQIYPAIPQIAASGARRTASGTAHAPPAVRPG